MNKKKVQVIGLGYIGLPTAALIAGSNLSVHGVDINSMIIEEINAGRVHIVEPSLDKAVSLAVENGLLKASTITEEADVHLIVVPTPFKASNEPDVSYVKAATRSILPLLKSGDLYIIESTCPIGTTESMMNYIYRERPELKDKIYIAYCPERVLPGNVMFELVHNDRVIGGVNDLSTKKAIDFYKQFVKSNLHETNSRTAEMCKLTENSSRDVQIAFANELSIICDKAGIDVLDLIRLANKHPRVSILQPGCGVGGHCIAVDPYFLISDYPSETQLIKKAREVNSFKTSWCLGKIEESIKKFEESFNKKPTVAILGLAFKPNIDDLRESPALAIALEMFAKYPKDLIHFVEPNIKEHNFLPLTSLESALDSDLLFILVAHAEFKSLKSDNIFSFVQL